MKVEKNNLSSTRAELLVSAAPADLEKYLPAAAERLAGEIKLAGFRPGKAPYEIIKQQLGAAAVWEEATKIFIAKTLEQIINEQFDRPLISQPTITITKLAPGNDLTYKVEAELLPAVVLGDYHNLKVKPEKVEVTEEEVEKAVDELRQAQAKEELSEGPVTAGDKVIVGVKMFLDKVPVEGGQTPATIVIVGKNYFIPGFDQKLIGAAKGEQREFVLPYPADHFQKNLAGKKIEFQVAVKEVYRRILPQITDAWAQSLQLADLTELKNNIKKSLLTEKERRARDKLERQLIEQLADGAKIDDLPETMVAAELAVMLEELRHNVSVYGGKFEDYLTSLGKTVEDLRQELRPEAVKRLRVALAMRQLAETEKIVASEEEVVAEKEHLLKHYPHNDELRRQLDLAASQRRLAGEVVNKKIIERLCEWNIK